MLTGELQGIWWLPDTPERTARGVLTIEQEARPTLVFGPSIEPDVSPTDSFRSIFGQGREIPLVYGRTSSGQLVTLTDGRLAVDEMYFDDPDTATYELQATTALIGQHLDPRTDRYERLVLSIEHLAEWRAASAFKIDWHLHSSHLDGITLEGTAPPDLVSRIPGGEVALVSAISNSGDSRMAPALALSSGLRVTLERGQLLADWFTGYVGPLTRLISLATGRPIAAQSVVISQVVGDESVEVVWPHRLKGRPGDRTLSPAEILFDATSLSDARRSIGAWLAASSTYRPVCDAFFATRDAATIYEEDRFQNLIHAVEAYHRRRVANRPDQGAHQERVERVVGSVAVLDRSWVSRALKHSGEYQLQERILGLLKLHPWLIGSVVPKKPGPWATKVVAARNAHAHHDPDALPVAATTWDLIGFSQRLSVLIEACLLSEIGFPEPAIEEMIRRASPAYQILQLNAL